MALLMDAVYKLSGETITNSYVNISDVLCKKNKEGTFDCSIKLSYYFNQAARDSNQNPFIRDRYSFEFDPTSTDNIYEQAYTFLKSLDEFSGATDA